MGGSSKVKHKEKTLSFNPCLENSSAEQPPASTGFAQAAPYNG